MTRDRQAETGQAVTQETGSAMTPSEDDNNKVTEEKSAPPLKEYIALILQEI